MKETRIIMNMPIAVEIVGAQDPQILHEVFEFFADVDRRFSFFRDDSEVAALNRGEEPVGADLQEIVALAEQTKHETGGFFDARRSDGRINPSGITKGWAIYKAAEMLRARGYENFLIDAGGDIHAEGKNPDGGEWRVGVRDPFQHDRIVKVLTRRGRGVATSGSYIRGAHIYNPHDSEMPLDEIVSLTVIGPDILDADRFATGAFAMGKRAAAFIESLPDFEAYVIDAHGVATMTSNFEDYVATA